MSLDSVLKQAEKDCRQLACSHYENFLVASVLLPRRLRQPFYNVYAFCRTADDLADESPSPDVATSKLNKLQSDLDATFAGNPPDGPMVALHHTVHAFQLSKRPFDDLLDAFRQDQFKHRYANIDELLDYCRRSANPVGRIVLDLAGATTPDSVAGSDAICTGLQLANFWQDVSRDFAIGRVYLPQDRMEQYSVQEHVLSGSTTPDSLKRLLRSECDSTEQLFDRGLKQMQDVPKWFYRNVRLFAEGGRATLQAIRDADFDVLRSRPRVGKWTQTKLLLRTWAGI